MKQVNISVPVLNQVIYTNQNVEFAVKDSETEIYEKIHRIEQFTYHFRKIKKSHLQRYLSQAQIEFIYQTIADRCVTPFWKDHLLGLGIDRIELIKGFMCYDCNTIAPHVYGGWRCTTCSKKVNDMLYQNVIDCFLLNSATLNVAEIKAFLNLTNSRQVLSYMNKLGIKSEVAGRERVFISPIHSRNN
ncbi:hypothetical protein [Jeotgalibacillus sp. JSM ZJ347]|uniref:hypothetical protein n=1 Tax=Jeotgalibacillus sp. JSM ZJ347 TaxID=3342117 RepID=UPI0035A94D7E